ncbi:MAG: efflux RND transporter periplasmic adaptor subunit [Flavipsychrobacter sp.]
MKVFKFILSILPLLLFMACNNGNSSNKEEHTANEHHETIADEITLTQEQYSSAGIKTDKVTTRKMGNVIVANGKLDVPPQQMVSVSIPLAGFVKRTSLLEGVYVKKGQVIAVLENLDYVQIQQDYLDVKGQYEFAVKEYNRQKQLAEEKVNSEKTLQQAKASFLSLQARYKGLESKLKLMSIKPSSIENGEISSTINVYAPISGYITKVNVNVGQYVSPQDVLFRIVNTEHLHVELTVFEKDISRLEEGQSVRLKLANETEERSAVVHLIGREISKERTVLVHCHLDNEDVKLLPGMFLKAYIETNATDVYALPESAIIRFEGEDYVFVEEGTSGKMYHYKMVKASIGSIDRGFAAVTLSEGIGQDSNVVVNGGYVLLAKLKNSDDDEGGHGH